MLQKQPLTQYWSSFGPERNSYVRYLGWLVHWQHLADIKRVSVTVSFGLEAVTRCAAEECLLLEQSGPGGVKCARSGNDPQRTLGPIPSSRTLSSLGAVQGLIDQCRKAGSYADELTINWKSVQRFHNPMFFHLEDEQPSSSCSSRRCHWPCQSRNALEFLPIGSRGQAGATLEHPAE